MTDENSVSSYGASAVENTPNTTPPPDSVTIANDAEAFKAVPSQYEIAVTGPYIPGSHR